ncbi:MAG TPA: PEGA domain-containing protein [Archangium sp.]|uniref:PEGA domain-containing protein n=1 Tax=Archangium sp. TaxID=1872627 RepID=UPI002E337A03|nr:PEGA domain-containing protein [Archangium sp.]HEX5748445.1 PEGA domain-containing protein [Archangium sp.]
MRLKTPLALSLALLLGTASGITEAAPRRGSSASARKAKKKKTPAAEQSAPAGESTETPASEEPPPAADAPVAPRTTLAPAPAAPVEAAPAAPAPAPALQPAPPTWSGSVAVLAVPSKPDATPSAARVETDLRAALGARTEVRLVDLAALFPPPPPASLQQGDALFDEGKGFYDNLDPEAAAKKFTEAAAFYERYPVETKPERLARVYVFLGASRLLNGDTTGAQEAFTRAQLVAPSLQPESELFGQDVHEAFDAAKVALSQQPRGTLTIDSVPSGAQVLMKGENLGTTPLKDVELAPGPHPVVLTLPGYVPFGVFQPVAPSQRGELRPTLEPTPALAEARRLAADVSTSRALTSDTLPAGVAELGEKLGARYVVLARVEQDRRGRAEAVLYAWDVRQKNRLRGVKLHPEDPRSREDAVRQVHAFLTGQHVPGPSLPVALPAVMKKPWFWAAVGGVAAATTAGILLASQPQKPLGARLGNFGAGW